MYKYNISRAKASFGTYDILLSHIHCDDDKNKYNIHNICCNIIVEY